ncbi:hypothetical protein TRIATDRAFT_302573 [Trichoderma atroviride IMI 206040]|uniref:Uncharacterized protein n=1 Tax=Hypocrea atroviridis (strain ATCC 20476 / IMI 206040) TaxID=452589 RepID=G9PAT3_HYPAI|nr:uncharacterized protein TRIATDRAFT_302573 [Trichoderma atroviride IMI 206040]EHK40115.1 hypothetical protein TRIATDRAFT_302573 [Trichoderma atroviride IMI 206040]
MSSTLIVLHPQHLVTATKLTTQLSNSSSTPSNRSLNPTPRLTSPRISYSLQPKETTGGEKKKPHRHCGFTIRARVGPSGELLRAMPRLIDCPCR